MWTRPPRCDAHLARKWTQRDFDTFRLIKPRVAGIARAAVVRVRVAVRPKEAPDLKSRCGEGWIVRQETESRDQRRPAPCCGLHGEDIDLEHVSGMRAGDVHRAVDLIERCEDEAGDGIHRGRSRDLTIRRVEAIEGNSIAGGDVYDWLDAGEYSKVSTMAKASRATGAPVVPSKVALRTFDGVDRHAEGIEKVVRVRGDRRPCSNYSDSNDRHSSRVCAKYRRAIQATLRSGTTAAHHSCPKVTHAAIDLPTGVVS